MGLFANISNKFKEWKQKSKESKKLKRNEEIEELKEDIAYYSLKNEKEKLIVGIEMEQLKLAQEKEKIRNLKPQSTFDRLIYNVQNDKYFKQKENEKVN